MDGADISDPEMGGATFTNFNVDAVEEIAVEFRLDAGGDRTRSGGIHEHRDPVRASGFHGSVFEFVRNSALDARNYFDYATACVARADSAVQRQ